MLGVMNLEYAPERPVSVARVLIVDDFELWKDFVIARLEEQPDLSIVGTASDGLQAVQKAEELQPDLILLDMFLPKLNGIEAVRQIRKLAPKSKKLFVSGESAWELVRTCFRVGGSGYVLKMDAATDLLAGVEAVLQGKQFVSPSLADLRDVADAEESEFEHGTSASGTDSSS
jgi:DNA-binding NarL/FixJ family response regulator